MTNRADSKPIETYAMIGDTQTAALVCSTGSIDWLCLPRFDSPAIFAALLGNESHGRWRVFPDNDVIETSRTYRGDTLILETTLRTATGAVKLIDFMPPRGTAPDVVRIVEGLEGTVTMNMELVVRFDYGSVVPWARRRNGDLTALAGPDALVLRTPIDLHGENLTTVGKFEVKAGDRHPFVLTWYPGNEQAPDSVNGFEALEATEKYWTDWAERCTYKGVYQREVVRSLLTLKALTFKPSGGIVAAATTSLPEAIGGERNWDYRFCWLRDASFTLTALMAGGYSDEARAWRDWLLRAVAGDPEQIQIMYGANGERRLTEVTLDWLPGYENSRPVRTGNAASEQFQLDVYGELMDCLHQASRFAIDTDGNTWSLQKHLLAFLQEAWKRPDQGIWEVRGPQRHFTHSKVMAWVAFDRAIAALERDGNLDGPVDSWREIRDQIKAEVLEKGFNTEINSFTQYYGSTTLDASLLTLPLVGFIDANDERMTSTIEAIQRDLSREGLVLRYLTGVDKHEVDGLKGEEGAFLPCSFWLANCLALLGRIDEAEALFDRLLKLQNDLGLLSEEYDTERRRLVGNFPQAFSHVELINTAMRLEEVRQTNA